MNYFSLGKFLSILLVLLLILPANLIAQSTNKQRVIGKQTATLKKQSLETVLLELSKLQPVEPRIKKFDLRKKNDQPPADNAPLDELIEYWKDRGYQSRDDKNLPSEMVAQRLLDACLNRPETCNKLMNLFPKTPATFDALFLLLKETPENEKQELYAIQNYLRTNSQYFREELVSLAQGGRGSELKELARLDWHAAKPLIEKLSNGSDANKKISALIVSRDHALEEKDSVQADTLLAQLKLIVIDSQLSPYQRSNVVRYLMEGKWEGRVEWFLSLIRDPMLSGLESFAESRPTLNRRISPSGQVGADGASGVAKSVKKQFGDIVLVNTLWNDQESVIPKVIELVGNSDPQLHNSAVSFLAGTASAVRYLRLEPGAKLEETSIYYKATQAILPWLSNKNWAQAPGRNHFIVALVSNPKPEYVPALMAIISDETEEIEIRSSAIICLYGSDKSKYIPFFKGLIPNSNKALRELLVSLVFNEKGFSEEELFTGFEAFLRYEIANEGNAERVGRGEAYQQIQLEEMIGASFNMQSVSFTDSLLIRILERAKALRNSEPLVAQRMLAKIDKEKNRIVQLNFLERVRNGEMNAKSLSEALIRREDFQKNVSESLLGIVTEGGYFSGIASVMLGENGRSQEILSGRDADAQLAWLICSRFVRDKIAPMQIMPLLSNPVLVTAAENYLEIENSPEARAMIWARHPNQAWIVGEAGEIDSSKLPEPYRVLTGNRKEFEKKLQAEILDAKDLESIYAFIPPVESGAQQGNPALIVIRVKSDSAELNLNNSKGFQKKRMLSSSEFRELKNLISQPEIENLEPEVYPSLGGMELLYCSEFLRIAKDSGRRILLQNLRRAPKKDATPHEQLAGIFYSLMRTGDFKIRYDIEDQIRGLEVVYANEKNPILGVGMETQELRVLVTGSNTESISDDSVRNEHWYNFKDGQIGKVSNPPSLFIESSELEKELQRVYRDGGRGNYLSVIRSKQVVYVDKKGKTDEAGIYKFSIGGNLEHVLSGRFIGLEVTSDEKWLVTSKINYERATDKISPYTLIRVNLKTREEIEVKLPVGTHALYPHCPSPSGDKILLAPVKDEASNMPVKTFWLDAHTGKIQATTGDLRPLLDKGYIPFQPTSIPHSYWVAFFDDTKETGTFGLYDDTSFTYKPILELPKMEVGSSNIWADEAGGYVYLVHEGNLLRLPLK